MMIVIRTCKAIFIFITFNAYKNTNYDLFSLTFLRRLTKENRGNVMESFHPCSKQIGRGNLEILSVSAVESAAFNQRPKTTSIQFHF